MPTIGIIFEEKPHLNQNISNIITYYLYITCITDSITFAIVDIFNKFISKTNMIQSTKSSFVSSTFTLIFHTLCNITFVIQYIQCLGSYFRNNNKVELACFLEVHGESIASN